ncbi:hypothetical protein OROMI_007462 [Orobanche minor]
MRTKDDREQLIQNELLMRTMCDLHTLKLRQVVWPLARLTLLTLRFQSPPFCSGSSGFFWSFCCCSQIICCSMANSASTCGLLSSSSFVLANSPALQRFSPDLDAISSPGPTFDPRNKVPGFLNLLKRLEGYDVFDNDFRATPSPDVSRSALALATNQTPVSEPTATRVLAPLVPPLLFGGDGVSPPLVDDVISLGSVGKSDSSPLEENLTIKEGLLGNLASEDPLTPESDHIYFGKFKVNTNGANDFCKSYSKSTRVSLKYIKPEIINGNVFVRPSWEVAQEGRKKWEKTAVGYFLGKKIPFMGVKNFAHSVWKGLLEVKATSSGFYFFKFDSEKCLVDTIEGGPWIYSGQPLFIERWREGMTLEKRNHKEVPIWVKFRNIPTEYWTEDGLSIVASAVGRPLYPDAITSSMERIDYARVCVMISVNDKLLDNFFMFLPSANGEYNGTCQVVVEYEWKPAICGKCNSFGHVDKDCPLVIKAVHRQNPVYVYVPKPHSGNTWCQQGRLKKATVSRPKEKSLSKSSPLPQHKAYGHNPFSILENPNIDDILVRATDQMESPRGPNHAAPAEVTR